MVVYLFYMKFIYTFSSTFCLFVRNKTLWLISYVICFINLFFHPVSQILRSPQMLSVLVCIAQSVNRTGRKGDSPFNNWFGSIDSLKRSASKNDSCNFTHNLSKNTAHLQGVEWRPLCSCNNTLYTALFYYSMPLKT